MAVCANRLTGHLQRAIIFYGGFVVRMQYRTIVAYFRFLEEQKKKLIKNGRDFHIVFLYYMIGSGGYSFLDYREKRRKTEIASVNSPGRQ